MPTEKSKMLILLIISIVLLSDKTFAQSFNPPITQETCDALESIADSTASSPVAVCTVLEEGCNALECSNPAVGSSLLTLVPCGDPEAYFEAQFFNSTDDLIHEQNLTTGVHYIPFGDTYTFKFNITQEPDEGIGLKVDLVVSGSELMYIRYTVIPIDYTLCSPTESPTDAGSKHVVEVSLLMLLLVVTWAAAALL